MTPSEKTVFCPYCQAEVEPRLTVSGPHLRADCPTCGRYVKFVKQTNTDHLGMICRQLKNLTRDDLAQLHAEVGRRLHG